MEDKTRAAMEGYVEAYTKNEKDLFLELWDSNAVFEDPVGSDPCKGIEAIGNFWDFAHAEGMTTLLQMLVTLFVGMRVY